MDPFFYNKSGLVAAYIARDCLILETGDRLPTISDYCKIFGVSRGIVQNAIAFLQNEGAVYIETGGAKGTRLAGINPEKVVQYTGWDSISVAMPLPFDRTFTSLTTAIYDALDELPLPTSFAYISGAEHRMRFLQKQAFDFSIFSLNTAENYAKTHDFFDPPIILPDCSFSGPFVLLIRGATEIQDGMRVLYDPNAYDHYQLTKALAQGKNVQLVEFPYAAFSEIANENFGDCAIVRKQEWVDNLIKEGFEAIPIEDTPFYSQEKACTPAILTHKENYGMYNLLKHYIHPESLCQAQQKIIETNRPPRLY